MELLHCLICNRGELNSSAAPQCTAPTICVKSEAGCEFVTSEVVPNAGGTSTSTSTSLDTFCKLVQLSTTCKNALIAKLPPPSSETPWPIFCAECQIMIENVADLFEQVRRLQNQIEKSKNQVETQIQKCFTDHVSNSGDSRPVHKCTSARTARGRGGNLKKSCSIVEQFRDLIVSELHVHGVENINIPQGDQERLAVFRADRSTQHEHLTRTRRSSAKSKTRKRKSRGPEVILGDLNRSLTDDDTDCHPNSDDDMDHQLFDVDLESVSDLDEPRDQNDAKLKPCVVKIQKIDSESSPKAKTIRSQTRSKPKPVNQPRGALRTKKPKNGKCEGPNKCTECGAVFQGKRRLNYHYNKVHGVTKFATFCTTCGKRFYQHESLETHLRVQGGTCQKYKFPDSVTVQMEHDSFNFKCNLCGRATPTREQMLSHVLTHTKGKRFACEICGEMLKLRASLKSHMLLKHSDPNVPHPFACPEPGCGKLLRNQKFLDLHQKAHRQEYDHYCDRCPFRTVHAHGLKRHEKLRPYPCPHCPKAYKKGTQLKKHVYSVHTRPEDRPFKCSICGKTFSEKFTLDRHEIIHTNHKPIKCSLCDKRFAVHDYLRIHMKTHSKEPRKKSVKNNSLVEETTIPTTISNTSLIPEKVDIEEPGEIVVVYGP